MKKLLFALLFLAGLTSCNFSDEQQQTEQDKVEANMDKLQKKVAIPQLDNSLERQNISKRLTLFEDENKVSYIYLISFGKVMAFYTVKGKVSSGAKRLSSTQKLVNPPFGQNECVMEAPELDGTYGGSASYIFFWTTDGTYVQWNDAYMLADKPLKLTTQPELIRAIN